MDRAWLHNAIGGAGEFVRLTDFGALRAVGKTFQTSPMLDGFRRAFVRRVMTYLGARRPGRRIAAVNAISRCPGLDAAMQADALLRVLSEDKMQRVRAAAARALGHLARVGEGQRHRIFSNVARRYVVDARAMNVCAAIEESFVDVYDDAQLHQLFSETALARALTLKRERDALQCAREARIASEKAAVDRSMGSCLELYRGAGAATDGGRVHYTLDVSDTKGVALTFRNPTAEPVELYFYQTIGFEGSRVDNSREQPVVLAAGATCHFATLAFLPSAAQTLKPGTVQTRRGLQRCTTPGGLNLHLETEPGRWQDEGLVLLRVEAWRGAPGAEFPFEFWTFELKATENRSYDRTWSLPKALTPPKALICRVDRCVPGRSGHRLCEVEAMGYVPMELRGFVRNVCYRPFACAPAEPDKGSWCSDVSRFISSRRGLASFLAQD